MTSALALLVAAFQLLAVAQANPGLPQSFRDQAVSVATHAITVAQTELAKADAPLSIPISQPLQLEQPQTFGTITPMPEVRELSITLISQTKPDPANGLPFGAFNFAVGLVIDGKHQKAADITMGNVLKQANAQTTSDAADWTASFEYIPTDSGKRDITFSSGAVSAIYSLTVRAPRKRVSKK